MISTTHEQSARLIACGVDPQTADMTGVEPDYGYKCEPWSEMQGYDTRGYFPAWSLSCLLELLPTSIMSPLGNEYMLELSKLRMHNAWEVQWWYSSSRFTTYDKQKKFRKLWDKSPIEACVKAIEWLTANGYRLNEVNFTKNKNEKK